MEKNAHCPTSILVFAASLRKDSLNARLALLAARAVTARGAALVHAGMSDFDCPSFDGDREAAEGIPPGAQRFHDRLQECDAFIIASPEYNASMPGVLKNAIDWTSRFRPQPFNGKQGLLMSASPSMVGGNRGLWSLRVPLEHLGARIYPDMFSLAQADEGFTPDGALARPSLQQRLESVVASFLDLVEASKHYPAVRKQWVEFLGEHPTPATDRVETTDTK